MQIINNNSWKYLTVCKQMSSGSFENNVNNKVYVYKLYIYIYIYIYILAESDRGTEYTDCISAEV